MTQPRRNRPDAAPTPSRPPGGDARRAALDLLTLIGKGASLDEALDKCRSFGGLEGSDRAFARALATAVLRRRGALDHVIGLYVDKPFPARASRAVDILRLAAAQLVLLRTPDHAAVSTMVALAKEFREIAGYAGMINAVSRRIAKHGLPALEKLPERIDTPGWMWRGWERAFGANQARAIARAHRSEPPLDLTPRDENDAARIASLLEGTLTPTGSVRLPRGGDVAALPEYESGSWWVQDAAAALPVRLLGDVAGKTVLDLCAAPGGKTMQLAARGALVTAVDIAGLRLKQLAENLKRTGLAAETVKADLLSFEPAAPVDAVLLDAPCTATGTIRRHPDALWSRTEEDLGALGALQAKMIDRAASFLKPGGLLLYCVCSLQPEEGERQIAAVLARRPDLARRPIEASEIGVAAVNRDGDLRTLPSMFADSGGMDGFFAARLVQR